MVISILSVVQPTVKASGPPYAWAGPTDINQATGQDNLPAAVEATNGTSANTLWLAWQTLRFSATRPDIIFRTFYNGTWGSVGRATSTFYNTTPALVQMSNGTIFLLYAQLRTNVFNIWYQRYSVDSTGTVKCNFGGGSCPAIQLTNPTSYNDTSPTAVVAKTGTVWVFWQRTNQTGTLATKQLYYKTLSFNSTISNWRWSRDTKVPTTIDSNWNWLPSATVTKDGLVRLAWSKGGQSSGTTDTSEIVYLKTYNGTVWSPDTQLTVPGSGFGDQHPSIIQDRNGTIWVFYSRTSLTTPQFVLFDRYSLDNGQTWAAESQMLTEASGIDDQQPFAIQGFANNTPASNNDRVIHLFYSSDRTGNDYDIWSITSPSISPVHDLGVTSTYYTNTSNGPVKFRGGVPYLGENSNVTLSMNVQNYGDTGENVRASMTLTNVITVALTQTVAVRAGASYNFVFNWNTTANGGARLGWYTMNATAVSLNSTETVGNRQDNTVIIKSLIRLIPWGDVDQSGVVTITDASVFFYDYGYGPTGIPCTGTHCQFFPYEDLDNDGNISIIDVGVAVRNYGIST